ncbi:conserved hypothetical protein, partial [Ricinus communis]
MWLAAKVVDPPYIQQYRLIAIVVADFDKRSTIQHIERQLFGNFANQRLLYAFARLDLAAGKFPQPALMQMR